MKKICCSLTGKFYEIKHQHTVIVKFEKRLGVVKRELNKDACKKRKMEGVRS